MRLMSLAVHEVEPGKWVHCHMPLMAVQKLQNANPTRVKELCTKMEEKFKTSESFQTDEWLKSMLATPLFIIEIKNQQFQILN